MRVLGIDPATASGWAILNDGAYETGGTAKFPKPTKSQIAKGEVEGVRWRDYRLWFDELLFTYKPDVVGFEDVRRHVSTLSGHAYGYFRYCAEACCADAGIKFYPINVKTWKSTVNSGNDDKDDTQTFLSKIYPSVTFVDDNHSDALGIALAVYEILHT